MRCRSANFSTKDSVPPLCNSEPGDIGLTYGFPSDVWPVLLTSVTVLGSPLATATIGAGTGAPDVFLRVTVESNVLVVRFRTSPERVIANWLVMSWVSAWAAVAAIMPSAITARAQNLIPTCQRSSHIRPPDV